MSNPWSDYAKLLAPGARTIVTVSVVNSDGSSTVTLRTGETVRVAGDSVSAGQKAIIQDGRILKRAPDLPFQTVEV